MRGPLASALFTTLVFSSLGLATTGCPGQDATAAGDAAITKGGSVDIDAARGAADSGVARQNHLCNAAPAASQAATDKVDLLFMLDDSASMEAKQKNLRTHVPMLVRTLVSAMRTSGDAQVIAAVDDLHIAIVDSDMGVPGVTGIGGCTGGGGDGVFQHTPHPSAETPTCAAHYAPFLSYIRSERTWSPSQIATDFGCVANLGAMGCGFEQQLEAVLKSLWPSTDGRASFVADPSGAGAHGHGDTANAGFLRDDSVVAVIVLSDEDDGSTPDTALYAPGEVAPSWLEPITKDNLNLRPLIGKNRSHLYPTARYINALRALHAEDRLVFAAIVGVPIDLVDDSALAHVDFSVPAQSDAYYNAVLADTRMQNTIDPTTASPALQVRDACATPFGHATPGARYVAVAKGLSPGATLYSICEDDYSTPMNRIAKLIEQRLGASSKRLGASSGSVPTAPCDTGSP